MIEMLGVLAIIGVLSVGAITGYQKAMLKYKLNKYSSDLSQMFFNLYDFKKGDDNLSKLQIGLFVPETLRPKDKANQTFFRDPFNNYWSVNLYGLNVRMGMVSGTVEGIYDLDNASIEASCPVIIQSAKDAQIPTMSLSHPGGAIRICDESECQIKPKELTISKINEFCNFIKNAINGNSILYFRYK